MHVSELAYYDIGLSNFMDVGETSADNQRVLYKDSSIELHQRNSMTEEILINQFVTEQRIVSNVGSITVNSTSSDILLTMEGIQKYFGGGGATRKSFKQDAKKLYKKMMRDPQEHLLAGYVK